ncbi:glutamate dehydrogenase [Pycnococcus provasolii]
MALLPTGLRAFSTWRSSLALVTSRASSSSASASSSSASSHAAALLASSPPQALLSDDDGNQQVKAPPSSPADNSSSLLLPKVMKWWKSRMPPAYLARVDPKAQERHARAVAVYAEQSENGNSSQLEETHVVSCIPDLTVFDPRDDTVTFIRGQDEPGVLISMLESLVHRAGERELVRADIFTSMDTALCANLLDYSPESVVSFDEANSTLDADELALATKVRGTEGSIASATPIKVRENGAPQAWKLRVAATNVVGDFALQRIAAYVGLFGLNIAEGRLVTLQDDRAKIRGKPARVTVTSLTIAWPRTAAGWPFVRKDDAAPLTPGGHKRGTLGAVFCSELARCTKHLDDRAWELGLCTPLGITRAELLWAFATAMQPSLARDGGPHEFAISRVYEMLEQAEILPLAGELASAFLARFDPAGPGGSAPDESANRLREEAFTSTVQAIRARAEATVDDPAARRVLHAIADCALATTRTNVFVPGRQALALRIDSSLMLHPSSPKAAGSEKPYTTIFVAGRRFAGFHVRYRDVARGGLRLVVPSSRDVHAMELQRCHDEQLKTPREGHIGQRTRIS